MVKVFSLVGKERRVLEERHRRWSDPVIARRCGIQAYVRDRILPETFPGFPAEFPYSEVVELWFAELEAAVAEVTGDGIPFRMGDVPDAERPSFVVTRENVVIPGQAAAGWLKVLFFIRHKDGKERRHFQEYWRNRHAPLVIGTPGLERYVQCHVAPEADVVGQANYDGVAELYFAGRPGFERCWGSPEIQEVQLPDTANFVGRGAMGFFVEETRVL